MHKGSDKGVLNLRQRIVQNFKDLKSNKKVRKVGIDTKYINFKAYLLWKEEFKKLCSEEDVVFDIELVEANDLIDKLRKYKEDDKILSKQSIFHHKLTYSGETVESKVNRIRTEMKDKYGSSDYSLIVSDLSEIAWIMNLRGRYYVSCSPIFFGYILITATSLTLACTLNSTSLKDKELMSHFENLEKSINFKLIKYESFENCLESELSAEKATLMTKFVSQNLYNVATKFSKEVLEESHTIVSHLKAQKNDIEIQQMIKTSEEDSVAMCRFLHWFDNNIKDRGKKYNEIEVADILENFRKEGKEFESLSFETISSYGSNGAIIHYSPEEGNVLLKEVGTDSLYLVDSGGQYYSGGTTDVTRTVIINEPSKEMKKFFTLVLDGHAQLAITDVRNGTTTLKELDDRARAPLMAHKANYAHGTSHGVGGFLNVHELPVGYRTDQIRYGMCFSNEPGYYKDDHWGIRIESVVVALNKEATKGDQLMLYTMNLIPIQRKLIELEFISETSRKWLNEYHKKTFKVVGPLLLERGFKDVHKWLSEATKPV